MIPLSIVALDLLLLVIFIGFIRWLFLPLNKSDFKRTKDMSTKPLSIEEARKRWNSTLKVCPKTNDRYLIIGGGFLGSRIILALLHRGENDISVFDYNSNSIWSKDKRVRYIQGDIRNFEQVKQACSNADTVFFTAAIIRYMDNYEYQLHRSYDINVIGASNVLRACKESATKRLIQTSTSHVTVPKDCNNYQIDEKSPYVSRENAASLYGYTKAISEQLAIAAHETRTLNICVIRPCSGIFGLGDVTLMDTMLTKSKYMFLHFEMNIDWVYVDNICYAHLLSESFLRLKKHDKPEVFCISNDQPMTNKEFRWKIKDACPDIQLEYGYPNVVYAIAYILDVFRYIMKRKCPYLGELEYLSVTSYKLMELNYTASITKAKKLLGYQPIFSVEEGIQLTALEHKKKISIFQ